MKLWPERRAGQPKERPERRAYQGPEVRRGLWRPHGLRLALCEHARATAGPGPGPSETSDPCVDEEGANPAPGAGQGLASRLTAPPPAQLGPRQEQGASFGLVLSLASFLSKRSFPWGDGNSSV